MTVSALPTITRVYISIVLIFLSYNLLAQDFQISQTVPNSVTVSETSDAFGVEITNNGTTLLSNILIQIDLPTGINCQTESLVVQSNQSVSGESSSENRVSFTIDGLSPGENLMFTYTVEASCEAIQEVLAGEIFRHNITAQAGSILNTQNSASYNLLYASLNIIQAQPSTKTLLNGESYQRTLTIVNAGNGKIDAFTLLDEHPEGLLFLESDKGVLQADQKTVLLSANDFMGIGDKDGFFDKNESIQITQTLKAETCTEQTYTSNLKAVWFIGEDECQFSSRVAHTSIELKMPSIQVQASPNIPSCLDQNLASRQEINFINNGAGASNNTLVTIYNRSENQIYNPNIAQKSDLNSLVFTYSDGRTVSPTITNTQTISETLCFGPSAVGYFDVQLPPLKAGESGVLSWNMHRCCISSCTNEKIMGYSYTLSYTDSCNTQTFDGQDVIQETNDNLMTFFTETPPDIMDGQKLPFNYLVSSHSNTLPVGEGAHYKAVFDLPIGLVFESQDNDLVFTSGPHSWEAQNIFYNAQDNTLEASFYLDAPFTIAKSEVSLQLRADCGVEGALSGSKSISMQMFFTTDETCQTTCEIPISCKETTETYLHCPGNCSEGMRFLAYDINRTSFGKPDNNQDGYADMNGALDLSKIKTERAMFSDTLLATFSGVVKTSAAHPSFTNGYASSQIPMGYSLKPLSAQARIYDASANTYLQGQIPLATYQTSGQTRTFFYDFSVSTLQTGNVGFDTYIFEEGDSVWVDGVYRVDENLGGNIQEVTINNTFYVSHTENPSISSQKYQCNTRRGRITFMGYYFTTSGNLNTTISNCNQLISQNVFLSIGDCCSNYNGGNLFPYEYRSWAHVKTVEFTIPENYSIQNMYFKQWNTKHTNASIVKTVSNIMPDQIASTSYRFDMAKYYEEQGGNQLSYSDDGFRGTFYLDLAPNCFVPKERYLPVTWDFQVETHARIQTQVIDLDGGQDNIRYRPRTITLFPKNPIVDGVEKTVKWQVDLKTNSGSVNNTWVHFKVPSGQIDLLYVVNTSTGDTLIAENGLYKIGEANSEALDIIAKYNTCDYDHIEMYAGYECSGYPVDFESFQCGYRQLKLYVEPKPSELQAVISGTTVGDACSPIVEVELEIASVQLAVVKDLFLDISLPQTQSISYVTGSTYLEYPLESAALQVQDPQSTSQGYSYDFQALNVQINASGLPGVFQLDKNRAKIRFQMMLEENFTPSEVIETAMRSKRACGADLPVIRLAYDPSVKFEQKTIEGPTTSIKNTWSSAWVDVDNNGFEDLYISAYDQNQENELFLNNGDGTFSLADGFAPQGISTVSSSWADVDNDGDKDVLLSNNIGANNVLYLNSGKGKMTKSEASGLTYSGYAHSTSFADYDNDGHLDVFVADYMPTKFNGLFHNNGDGTFTKIENTPITKDAKYSVYGAWADIDNDGDQDLLVVNTNNQTNDLYENLGSGSFSKTEAGALTSIENHSVGASFGDIDSDGDLDLFIANASEQNNELYLNDGGVFTWQESATPSLDRGHSHGSSFVDFDNDGDLDLLVTNDQNSINFFYTNNGNGTFSKLDNPVAQNTDNAFAHGWSDYDNDGDLDLYITNHDNKKNSFYENTKAQCSSWLCLRLEGTRSNRDAIGARVSVLATMGGQLKWQTRVIQSSWGGGPSSQSTLKAMFGLSDAVSVDSVKISWPSGVVQNLSNLEINSCHDIIEPLGEKVCGSVFEDLNGNCQLDENEPLIKGQTIKVNDNNTFLNTDDNGYFQTYLQNGSYVLEWQNAPNWHMTCDKTKPIIVQENSESCGHNFGLTPTCLGPDLEASVSGSAFRRGLRNQVVWQVENKGTQTAYDVQVYLHMPSEIDIVLSDTPWVDKIDSTYTWQIDSLEVGESYTLQLTDSVSRLAKLDAFLTMRVQAEVSEDCGNFSSVSSYSDVVVGSVDPNDKQVFPKGISPVGYIKKSDTLTYKIRFQNVGTYAAERVLIIDTLSEHLDLTTLHHFTSSHPMQVLREGRQLKFLMQGIHLPDSVSNEPESHGFVTFKVLPKAGLLDYTLIENTAHIQFDFNDFITTNTVKSTPMGNLMDVLPIELMCYPNPVLDRFNLKVFVENIGVLDVELTSLSIKDIRGHVLLSLKKQELTDISVERLPPGAYIVEVRDEFFNRYTAKLIKR